MNTYYKNSVTSPLRVSRNEKAPILEEITRSVGTYNLTAVVTEDKDTLSMFSKNVPGLIAFICTLKKGDEILGEGRGTAVLNRMNKYVERGVRYAFNASLIDAMVRSTKTLDALYLKSIPQGGAAVIAEVNVNNPAFFTDETQKYATDKQKTFLTRLINKNCKGSTKEDYLSKLNSPYLSKFNCSEMINSLLANSN